MPADSPEAGFPVATPHTRHMNAAPSEGTPRPAAARLASRPPTPDGLARARPRRPGTSGRRTAASPRTSIPTSSSCRATGRSGVNPCSAPQLRGPAWRAGRRGGRARREAEQHGGRPRQAAGLDLSPARMSPAATVARLARRSQIPCLAASPSTQLVTWRTRAGEVDHRGASLASCLLGPPVIGPPPDSCGRSPDWLTRVRQWSDPAELLRSGR